MLRYEMLRCNLGNVILLLQSMGIEMSTFALIDAPPLENIRQAMYELWVLGALAGAFTSTN
jgi:HrpA-like RNA helicase